MFNLNHDYDLVLDAAVAVSKLYALTEAGRDYANPAIVQALAARQTDSPQ